MTIICVDKWCRISATDSTVKEVFALWEGGKSCDIDNGSLPNLRNFFRRQLRFGGISVQTNYSNGDGHGDSRDSNRETRKRMGSR